MKIVTPLSLIESSFITYLSEQFPFTNIHLCRQFRIKEDEQIEHGNCSGAA